MTTLESKISIGNVTYNVATLLKNLKGAFSKDEAMRWGFCIQMAFLEFGLNPDIDDDMHGLLDSQGVPPISAVPEERQDRVWGMPQTLINYIFKKDFNQEQLKSIWRWIKEYFIDEIEHPYQYLSLLLFLENHHSILLQKSKISNTEMLDQMEVWYPKAKVKCSADAIGTYRNGFISSPNFRYQSWLNTNGKTPASYELKRDQSISGFVKLFKLCNDLQIYWPELNI